MLRAHAVIASSFANPALKTGLQSKTHAPAADNYSKKLKKLTEL